MCTSASCSVPSGSEPLPSPSANSKSESGSGCARSRQTASPSATFPRAAWTASSRDRTRDTTSGKADGGTVVTVGAGTRRGYPRSVVRPRGARERVAQVIERLKVEYPDVTTALDHQNAYQLLVATILSAQTTDERVNMVTPALFAKYPSAADLAVANPDDVEMLIQSTGFFRSKTKSITGMAQGVVDRYGGEVPSELDDLVTLPGVGRKTGNVVRSVWFK